MPELPEVESVVRSLRKAVVGCTLTDVWSSSQKLRRDPNLELMQSLVGQKIASVGRVGKYAFMKFDHNIQVVSHLGMSGKWLLHDPVDPMAKHTHVKLQFSRNSLELRYVDPRRFGWVRAYDISATDSEWANLGPDPLQKEFTPEQLEQALKTTSRPIKVVLLDQSKVAGIGNIYASEALFVARIHPLRSANTLEPFEINSLHSAIVQVLGQAVERGGTSLSAGGYVNAHGQQGQNQHHVLVYGRQNEPCVVCTTPVACQVQAQRSTYFCPTCQKE